MSNTFRTIVIAAGLAASMFTTPALAAKCGNTSAGFDAWKSAFAKQAAKAGVGKRGLAALAGTTYAKRTIAADRNQKSFKYTLAKFMQVRGADTIVAMGRKRIAKNPAFYASLEKRFGVPAAVVVAIHGMETAFGRGMGDSNLISAAATLAYDCRRSDFFVPHIIAGLKLVDNGSVSSKSVGAKHGEWGHTQFLLGNVAKYGVDGNGDGRLDMTNMTDALFSTANYLRQKGWKPGKGYQEGQPNFRVIQEWNAAGVYQKAIAIMAGKIEK